MESYHFLLQVCLVFLVFFFLYLLIRFLRGLFLKNRLGYYSIQLENYDSLEYKSIYKVISAFSRLLESLVIFNGVARIYDKYIFEDSKLRKGMDYFSLKILVGFLLVLLYLFFCFFYEDSILVLLVLVSFVLGFVLPDFYCVFQFHNKKQLVNHEILNAVIMINNSFKANRTTEQAIMDVIVRSDGQLKSEFQKVLSDVKIGLEPSEAFHRMYFRTGLSSVEQISRSLAVVAISGIPIVDVFDEVEKRLLEEEKFHHLLQVYRSTNKIAHLLFLLLPLLFFLYLFLSNAKYLAILQSKVGVFFLLIEAILYLLYMLFLRKIVGGSQYDK